MKSLQSIGLVVGSARGFAVNGDQIMPARPQRLDPIFKTAAEENRINPVDQGAKPTFARNLKVKLGKFPKRVKVVFTPGGNLVEVITSRDRRSAQKQQNFR